MEQNAISAPPDAARSVTSRRAEQYAGVAVLLLCLGLGAVVYFAGAEPRIPNGLWLVLVALCVGGLLFAGDLSRPAGLRLPAYGVSVVSSWIVVASLPPQSIGMLVVLMVVVAAVGSYVIPFWATALVIVLNMFVVLGTFAAGQTDPIEIAVSGAFYTIIHLAAVFSTFALYRESQLRAELEQKNVELEAAGVLLEESAATAERLRISRELYDAVGHQLTVLNLELEAAKHRSSSGESAADHIERAASVAKTLLADVRSTAGELRLSSPSDLQANLHRLAPPSPRCRSMWRQTPRSPWTISRAKRCCGPPRRSSPTRSSTPRPRNSP